MTLYDKPRVVRLDGEPRVMVLKGIERNEGMCTACRASRQYLNVELPYARRR